MSVRAGIIRLREEERVLSDVIAGLQYGRLEPHLSVGERNDLVMASRRDRTQIQASIAVLRRAEEDLSAPPAEGAPAASEATLWG